MGFIKKTLITLSSRVLNRLLGIVTAVITVRVLGPAGKGEFALALVVVYFCYGLFKSGIEDANIYFLGTKKYSPDAIASTAVTLGFFIGLASVAAFFLAYPLIRPVFLKDVRALFIFIIVWEAPAMIVTLYCQNILLGLGRVVEYNLVDIVTTVVMLLGTAALVLWAGLGVMGAVLASLISVAAGGAAALLLVSRRASIRPRLDGAIARDLLSYGLKGHAGEIFYIFFNRLDVIMISHFLTIQAVGFYSVAQNAQMLWYVALSISTVLFQKVSSSSFEEANIASSIACRNTLFITAVMALFFMAGSYIFIPILFGKVFSPSIMPLWALLPGMIFYSVSSVLCSYLFGRGRRLIYTYACVSTLAVSLALNYALIPRLGIMGASIANSISYFIFMAILGANYLKISGNSLAGTLIIQRGDFAYYSGTIGKIRAFLADLRVFKTA